MSVKYKTYFDSPYTCLGKIILCIMICKNLKIYLSVKYNQQNPITRHLYKTVHIKII